MQHNLLILDNLVVECCGKGLYSKSPTSYTARWFKFCRLSNCKYFLSFLILVLGSCGTSTCIFSFFLLSQTKGNSFLVFPCRQRTAYFQCKWKKKREKKNYWSKNFLRNWRVCIAGSDFKFGSVWRRVSTAWHEKLLDLRFWI